LFLKKFSALTTRLFYRTCLKTLDTQLHISPLLGFVFLLFKNPKGRLGKTLLTELYALKRISAWLTC
jgi:hypothetical protein